MDVTAEFLKKVLSFSKLDEKYVHILTDRIDMYQQAFTSPLVDAENNYELYEKLGDATANEALVWYFYTVFPQLRCPAGVKVIATLKNIYGSSEYFSKFAEMLGFWPYVKSTEEDIRSLERKQKLLEDIFEAFIGVTKLILLEHFGYYGVGNEIAYTIMKALLDTQQISLKEEDLYDAKTRLKELFDKVVVKQRFGHPRYELHDSEPHDGARHGAEPKERYTRLYFVKDGVKTLISVGHGISKAAQEKNAAQRAIDFLKKEGIDFGKRAKLFCVNDPAARV